MKHYPIRPTITDRSITSINLYLKEISKYPVLTPEEEKLLSRSNKDEDKKKLVESNLRFVVSIAKQYQGKGLELSDLISAGNLGLMEAVKKFDSNQGLRFLSYAVWWIRDYILKELEANSKTVRLPAGKVSKLNKISKFISKYEQEFGFTPSNSEIANSLNLNESEVDDIVNFGNIVIVPNTSFNSRGEEESIFDYIPEEEKEEKLNNQFTSGEIIEILKDTLNPIEYGVITKFFGLNRNPEPYDSIGEYYNLTRERVRQIKDNAIFKLRKTNSFDKLLHYLG